MERNAPSGGNLLSGPEQPPCVALDRDEAGENDDGEEEQSDRQGFGRNFRDDHLSRNLACQHEEVKRVTAHGFTRGCAEPRTVFSRLRPLPEKTVRSCVGTCSELVAAETVI